jgi:hypothetical protein
MKRRRKLALTLWIAAALLISLGVAVCWKTEPPPPPQRSVQQIEKELESPDPQVRKAAADELGRRLGKERSP